MPLKFGNYPLRIHTLTKAVLAPLQFVVTPNHQVLVADSARSAIFKVGPTKLTKVLGGPVPGSVSGVDVNARGDLAYTWVSYSRSGAPGPTSSSSRAGASRSTVPRPPGWPVGDAAAARCW